MAVIVEEPATARVTANCPVPADKLAVAGSPALLSLEVRATEGVEEVTMFQYASVALTVYKSGIAATCPVGVPVFPDVVPGAADSPGRRICSLFTTPAPTVTAALVAEINADELA